MNNKGFKKLFKATMTFALVATVGTALAACNFGKKPVDPTKTPTGEQTGTPAPSVVKTDYTYNTYSTALGSNWNPHTWETSADDSILSYLSTGFVDLSIKDSNSQTYQWVYEMATSITDVTADHTDDLETYKATLPDGASEAADVTKGFVFEIALNKRAKWENGTVINADSYIDSMKLFLDPDMKNYRANSYYTGESELAGAYKYYYSKDKVVYTAPKDYAEAVEFLKLDGTKLEFDVYDFWGADGYVDAEGNACPQWLNVTDTTYYDTEDAWALYEEWMDDVVVDEDNDGNPTVNDTYHLLTEEQQAAYDAYADETDLFNGAMIFAYYGNAYWDYFTFRGGKAKNNDAYGTTWDAVGLYKVDDLTIRYVCQNQIDFNYFLTAMTSTWLVYEPLYASLYDTTGELKTTTYGTSKETSFSYGPYKMSSFQDGKQVVFVQNENWYGWTADAAGNLVSTTEAAGTAFKVDGEYVKQYQTTKIVIDVLDDAAAKQQFMKGQLSEWAPTADELSKYTLSSQLTQVDETYTMRLFYNTNLLKLQALDKTGNENSVVLSNKAFREALSLSIDRTEFVTATAGYKPACYLINSLYYYDVYNNPESIYRNTDAAKQSVCNLYGIEYGADKIYKTLDEAYESVTGYNLSKAQQLMKQAYDELVAAGLYAEGANIKIKIGWAKGALQADDQAQVKFLQTYFNKAVSYEGSKWGTITLEAVGNIPNRYSAVPAGDYAIGWGAWGGAAFYPFTMFRVYMDPDYATLNEGGCWDPANYEFTLNVPKYNADGTLTGETEAVTMTAQAWANATTSGNKYANAPLDVKVSITAQLEEQFLGLAYCTPICTTTACSLLSYKVNYYTDDYNIMYGFGGLRLMKYNYTDTQWAAYVASQNNQLTY